MPDLHVTKLTTLLPACDSHRHIAHPGVTCQQEDEWIAHQHRYLGQQSAAPRTAMCDIPPGLRGPNWTAAPRTS